MTAHHHRRRATRRRTTTTTTTRKRLRGGNYARSASPWPWQQEAQPDDEALRLPSPAEQEAQRQLQIRQREQRYRNELERNYPFHVLVVPMPLLIRMYDPRLSQPYLFEVKVKLHNYIKKFRDRGLPMSELTALRRIDEYLSQPIDQDVFNRAKLQGTLADYAGRNIGSLLKGGNVVFRHFTLNDEGTHTLVLVNDENTPPNSVPARRTTQVRTRSHRATLL